MQGYLSPHLPNIVNHNFSINNVCIEYISFSYSCIQCSHIRLKLACRFIGESCGHLTCLKHANYFSSLSPIKPSRLVNGYNRKSKMVLLRAATTIHNRLNIACGPTYANMIWERIICILVACDMRHGRLDFVWLAIWWSLQKNVWMCGCV